MMMSLDKNFNAADKAIDKVSASAKKEILKAYSESLNSVRSKMSFIYEKYSSDGTLSYADMTKYNRLVTLEKEIRQEVYSLSGVNKKTIETLSGDVFQESYFHTAHALEFEAQARLSYGMINPKIIEASIQNPLSGLSLNERLIKNRENIIINIRQQITQGLIQGESYPKMARRIKETLEGDAAKALRIAQTESHRVQTEGRLASMEHAQSLGVKMVKVWVATLDAAVRDTHAALDGQKVAMDEEFHIRGMSAKAPGMFGIAAEDINCRCTVRSEIEGYAPELRRSRKEGIIPYSDYQEWKDNRLSF
jgi:SPP1 gp7 family putative phage head morphogenesis protein